MAESFPERLIEATARLIGRAVDADDRFGLAVSGGADSMAMLALAVQCWPGQVEAATVDHGLRPDAPEEARMVAAWCAGMNIPHQTLVVEKSISGNVQAQARKARYRLLEAWRVARNLQWLMTAHQGDDQIETVLMRLNRGAGVGGLASIRARQGHILRPLLGFRRAELRDFCRASKIPFADDPSNADCRFDRARLRQGLAGFDLLDVDRLNRSVEALGQADEALNWATESIAADQVRRDADMLTLERTDLPAAILRRLLERMILSINENAEIPRGPSIDQALVQLLNGKTVTLGDCVVTGGDHWTVRRAPPRRAG